MSPRAPQNIRNDGDIEVRRYGHPDDHTWGHYFMQVGRWRTDDNGNVVLYVTKGTAKDALHAFMTDREHEVAAIERRRRTPVRRTSSHGKPRKDPGPPPY